MNKKNLQKRRKFLLILTLMLFISATSGCSKTPSGKNGKTIADAISEKDPNVKGSRDNTSSVLTPTAPGTAVSDCSVAAIDYSNAAEGYIMVNYFGANSKVKLQITGPDQITYTYNLHGDYEVFPLTAGSGSYTVAVYENISGNQYSTALSSAISVNNISEFGPYLYPSQYVNFNEATTSISKAVELAYPADNDIEVIASVYNYVISTFTYDYDKAKSVQSGYLPDINQIMQIKTGICFDYAAITASMLRSQRIPTRLEVGYKGEEYHAWISAYVKDVGWINGVIEFDGVSWKLMDPTFAATSSSPASFTADDDSYITKYVY